MKKMVKAIPVIAAAALMVACGGNKKNYENLVSQTWVLEKVQLADTSVKVEIPANLTISFADSAQLYGNGPCNNFFGPYTVTDNKIEFGNLASTMAYCLEMPFESDYLGWLGQIATFNATENTLTLMDADGMVTLYYTVAGPDAIQPIVEVVEETAQPVDTLVEEVQMVDSIAIQ